MHLRPPSRRPKGPGWPILAGAEQPRQPQDRARRLGRTGQSIEAASAVAPSPCRGGLFQNRHASVGREGVAVAGLQGTTDPAKPRVLGRQFLASIAATAPRSKEGAAAGSGVACRTYVGRANGSLSPSGRPPEAADLPRERGKSLRGPPSRS